MDRDLAFPDRSMGQNSIYSVIERRRLFFLLPNGTQGGITEVAALMAQIKRVNWGKLIEVLVIFLEEARSATDQKALPGSMAYPLTSTWAETRFQKVAVVRTVTSSSNDCAVEGTQGLICTQDWQWPWKGGSQSLQWMPSLRVERKQSLGLGLKHWCHHPRVLTQRLASSTRIWSQAVSSGRRTWW